MKPDLGLHLLNSGVPPHVSLHFHAVPLFDLTILGNGAFTSFAEMQRDGRWFAVSFDFRRAELDRLLSGVPGPTRAAILGALSTGFRTPRALDLPEPLYVDVQARLGRIQRNANEAYVPLVCEHLSLAVRRSPAPSRERDVHVIVVPRADVEASSQARTLGAIHRWVASHRDPRDAARRLTLRFSGYERDPRELWQIDAVRAFVAGVDRAFPFWFYVAELDTDFLKVLAFCLCRSSVARSGVTELNGDDFGKFLAVHFAALNQLMSEWGLSESETRRISDDVVTYFETSRRKP